MTYILILHGRVQGAGSGTYVTGLIYLLENVGFVINKPKTILEPTQFDRVPWVLSELSSTRTEPSNREGEKIMQGQDTVPVGRRSDHSQKAVPTSGQIASSNQGSTSGPSVLLQVTTGTAENVSAVRSGLLCPTYPLHRRAGRPRVVVRLPVCLE